MVDSIYQLVGNLTIELQVFIVAMFPIIELRGAIPYGVLKGMQPLQAALIAFLGSSLPVPFILLLLKPIFEKLKHLKFLEKHIEAYTHKTLEKVNNHKNFSSLALILFVGIPLPGTGAWTGSFGASLINFDFKKALLAVIIGNILAATIVTFLTSVASQAIG